MSQLSLMPDLSASFVTDIETILANMVTWWQSTILGESSRLRTIVTDHYLHCQQAKVVSDSPMDEQTSSRIRYEVEQHLIALVRLKTELFEDFALAIHKQIQFFNIVKVSEFEGKTCPPMTDPMWQDCRHRILHPKHSVSMLTDLHAVCVENVTATVSSSINDGNGGGDINRMGRIELLSNLAKTDTGSDPGCDDPRWQCQCPPTDSMLQLVDCQFGWLQQLLQQSVDLIKVLHWTRYLHEKMIFKVCLSRCHYTM